MYSKEQIESLHDQGKMPDRYYYALNGKSPMENLWEQKRKMYERLFGEDYSECTINSEVRIKK